MAAENAIFQVLSVPKFDGDYEHWSMLMKTLLKSKEYWVVIEPGYTEPREGTVLTVAQQTDLDARSVSQGFEGSKLPVSVDRQTDFKDYDSQRDCQTNLGRYEEQISRQRKSEEGAITKITKGVRNPRNERR